MKGLALHLFLISLPITANSQTCILLISENDSVVIAADGKAKVQIADTFTYRQDCKIRTQKKVYYFATGKDAGTLLDNADQSISAQKVFEDSIFFSTSKAVKQLENDIEGTRILTPKAYASLYKNKIFGHLVFVWFKAKIPRATVIEFKIISPDGMPTKVNARFVSWELPQDNKLHFYPFGTYDAIFPLLKQVSFWKNSTFELSSEKLLQIQSDAAPEIVGKPFSIVRIAKGYSKWYKKGKCE